MIKKYTRLRKYLNDFSVYIFLSPNTIFVCKSWLISL